MKRLLQLSTLLFAVILAGCAVISKDALPARSVYTIPSVNALAINNGSNVTVILGSPANRVTAYGAPVELSKSNDGTLSISPTYRSYVPSKVLVEVQRLSQIDLSNISNVLIQSRYRQTINLSLTNINQVQITGPLNIRNFKLDGVNKLIFGGDIHVKNVTFAGNDVTEFRSSVDSVSIDERGSKKINSLFLNSRELIVNATGNSFTKLAGSVKNLTVNLDQSAVLDAKFLRAKTVHVTTKDNAHASIYAINYLFAETLGPSRIDYFGLPKYIYKANSGQGVILPGEPKR